MEAMWSLGGTPPSPKKRQGGLRPPDPPAATLRLGGRFLLLPVLARVALDAPGRVDELLLPGEEGVAVRADLQPQLLALGGPGRPSRAAGAVDVADLVLGMNSWLHDAPGARLRRGPEHWILA